MTDSGVGFRVHPDTVHDAGKAAGAVADELRALAPRATAACHDVQPGPAGMDFGSVMRQIGPMWEQHLNNLAAVVQGTGDSLHETYGNYLNADHGARYSFHSILH